MGIVLEHLRRHVSSNCRDGAVTSLRFGKLRDRMVPQIREAQPGQEALYLLEVSVALRVSARLRGVAVAFRRLDTGFARVRLRHAVPQFVCGCVGSRREASQAGKPTSSRAVVMDAASTAPRFV